MVRETHSLQLSNTMADVIYNNINPMLLITSTYQQFNKENEVMTNDLLERALSFYQTGVPYLGDIILKEITDNSVRGYYGAPADDSLHRATEETIMQKPWG